MKKKIIVLALCVFMISGCGKKIPTLSNGDEAVVTLKDGSMISVNELYNQIKDDYALDSLINMIDKKILEDKYPDDLEDAKKSADTQMDELKNAYGDDLADAIKYYTGYSSPEAYKNSLYISYLQNLAILDYCKDQIDEKEVKKYYESDIYPDIKVSHILITAEVKDDMTDDEKAKKETEAKEKVETLISTLKKTKKEELASKFEELAKEQSMDESSKNQGGSLGFINKDTLSSSWKELVDAAYDLKDGEISTKVITTEIGYHVVMRNETKEKASIDDVRDSILETLAKEYLQKNSISTVKALQELRKKYDMEIVDSDLQSKYAALIQNQLDYYTKKDQETNNSNKQK